MGVNVLPVLVMVAREMVVSGFRLVAASRGSVIAADQSGKIKTGVQMGTAIGLTLAPALAPLLPADYGAVLDFHVDLRRAERLFGRGAAHQKLEDPAGGRGMKKPTAAEERK